MSECNTVTHTHTHTHTQIHVHAHAHAYTHTNVQNLLQNTSICMRYTSSHTHPKKYLLMRTYVSMGIVKHIRNRCNITATKGIHAEYIYTCICTVTPPYIPIDLRLHVKMQNHDHAVTLIRSFTHTYGMHILFN